MQNFFDWYRENYNDLPWLIIGKGPTFDKVRDIDIKKYNTIALNHVIEDIATDFSHVIDFDVFMRSGSHILENARFLVMPFYPHFKNTAGTRPLSELASENSLLRSLDRQNRLLWYNASSTRNVRENQPVVPVRYFSADAVTSLLAMAGEKVIWSAGIDGGSNYSNQFSHLNDVTLLANGRKSFNIQFLAIAEALKNNQAELIPLGESTINIFVGTTEEQLIATRLLEYSIRMRTSASVKLTPLYETGIPIPLPADKKNWPRTPFSFQRFLIPQLCSYSGRAIYLDSDMQVFTDIRDLAFREMHTQPLLNALGPESGGRKPQFSVMLLDCGKLSHWVIEEIIGMLDRGELTYEQLMHEMQLAEHSQFNLESQWNSLENFEPGKTKLLHYTDMESQPWLSRNNKLAQIWISELIDAVDNKFIRMEELKAEITAGNIRPSLLYQVLTRTSDPRSLPFLAQIPDWLFTPPHRQKRWHQKNKAIKHLKGIVAYRLAWLTAKMSFRKTKKGYAA